MVAVREAAGRTPNRVADFTRELEAALSDGTISKSEARELKKNVRRDGITLREQAAVRNAVNAHRDDFAKGAAAKLWEASFIGDYNSAALIENGARIARADDGRIGAADARRLIEISKDSGFTPEEDRALEETLQQERLNGPGRRVLERYVEETKTLPPRTEPETIRIAGIPVRTHGASQAAIDELERTLPGMLEGNADLHRRLQRGEVEISIVPADKKISDLAEFREFRNQTAPFGGGYDGYRGLGIKKDGKIVVALPEENLARLPTAMGRKDYSLAIHEIAHAVALTSLRGERWNTLLDLYEDRKKNGGPFTSNYARKSPDEFFSEASTAYFGRGPSAGRDATWLRRRDPGLYDFLRETYGPPRQL
jgi:hypothetical protein